MRKDPERLSSSYKPALVQLVDGSETFVSHQRTTEQGWLWCLDWDGSRRKVPPQRIVAVEYVETVRKSDDSSEWKEIKNDELCKRANELASPDQQRQTVVADGGQDPHPDAGGGSR